MHPVMEYLKIEPDNPAQDILNVMAEMAKLGYDVYVYDDCIAVYLATNKSHWAVNHFDNTKPGSLIRAVLLTTKEFLKEEKCLI